MDKSQLSETDICDKFITPALVNAGWRAMDQIYREFPLRAGRVVVRGSKAQRDKAPPQLMLSDKIIRLDVSALVNREFLNLSNNAAYARAHYAANASGTSSSMKNVSREVVLRVPVSLPPLAEQFRIVACVEELRRLCTDLRQRLAAGQRAQAQLAKALVQTAAV